MKKKVPFSVVMMLLLQLNVHAQPLGLSVGERVCVNRVRCSPFVVHVDALSADKLWLSTLPRRMGEEPFLVPARTAGDMFLLIQALFQFWQDGDWVNRSRSLLRYDDDGNLVEFLEQGLQDGVWVSRSRSLLRYDDDGNLVEILGQSWEDGDWVNRSRELRSYAPTGTATEDEAELPRDFALAPNYPNPFNPQTTIRFDLPAAMHVRMVVYDVMGREVARLIDQLMRAGTHAATWDASGLPSGTYLYRLTAGAFTETKAMTLLK